ncbi:hypothetical protein PROVALCAL_02852 [Providencia alcalifaciens DSM 30120]|uniref:Uncharacterized protein n=1 Tax=Providencia alcalifaciens DSM 30120 TaxID=520999 RepID=B6XHL5_9GAMM|nr:hypothetical protein PROVALCAL_02852 [Providencia alcalifaciens DSM 30120]
MIELIKVKSAAQVREITITFLRPIASEIGPVTNNPNAINPVLNDNDKLAVAGETLKSADNIGKIGWTK